MINDSYINVTSKTANEYTHPRNQLPMGTKSAKMRSSTELDNLLKISKYQYSRKDDGRHPFAKDGWDYYETIFNVDGKMFKGLINIGKSGNKKTLYDITQIKRISQNRSTSANAFTTSLANSTTNNISDSKQNVKSDTKYSMQNVGKNEQDIGNNSFNKNIKRYNDLLKTNYIEYFRKDNGDVRVNLIGSNNNLVNQLDLVTTTDAIKQLFQIYVIFIGIKTSPYS